MHQRSHSICGRAITSSAFGITHTGMPDALIGDVECVRVMWSSFDGVAFRSGEREKHVPVLHTSGIPW